MERSRDLAWRDAKRWLFTQREVIPLVVIGVLTLIGVSVWAPTGTALDALIALASVGVAALLIPSAVYLGSLVTAPHRILRAEVVNLSGLLAVKSPDKAEVLNRLGGALTKGIEVQMYLETAPGDGSSRATWDWEIVAGAEINEVCGSHEGALFASADHGMNEREAPEMVRDAGTTWTWHQADTKIRWLRQRIEEIREAD